MFASFGTTISKPQKEKVNEMTTKQKKSGHSASVSAQRSSDRAAFGTISIAQVDYPIPQKTSRTVKALRFFGNVTLATAFIGWLGAIGKSDFDPGYPVRDLLLNTLLCVCIAVLGLILHRIKNILMEGF